MGPGGHMGPGPGPGGPPCGPPHQFLGPPGPPNFGGPHGSGGMHPVMSPHGGPMGPHGPSHGPPMGPHGPPAFMDRIDPGYVNELCVFIKLHNILL